MSIRKNDIRICGWNANGLSSSKPFLKQLTDQNDVVCISEHWLNSSMQSQLDVNDEFICDMSCSKSLDPLDQGYTIGNGGIAILWRKSMSNFVQKLPNVKMERIMGIKLCLPNRVVFILCVYLPYEGCAKANFREWLDTLEELVIQMQNEGDVCVIGDMNSDIGNMYNVRGAYPPSCNGTALNQMCIRQSLRVADLTDKCTGPTYTFYRHYTGKSYVDHCIVSERLFNCCNKIYVMDDELINTSDHLPVCIELSVENICVVKSSNIVNTGPTRIAWTKVTNDSKNVYQLSLEPELTQLYNEIQSKEGILTDLNIELYFERLTQLLKNKANDAFPKKRFVKYLKPYWSETLKRLVKEKKSTWNKWVKAGKPRNIENVVCRNYKQAKREFQRELRRAEYQHQLKLQEEIDSASEISMSFFWSLVKSRRRTKQTTSNIKSDDGVLLTNPSDIKDEWKNYFSKLVAFNDNDLFDKDFSQYIDSEIEKINAEPSDMNDKAFKTPITEHEISNLCTKLSSNKSPGWDDICSEHLKLGGAKLISVLTILFKCIVQLEYIPRGFKTGVLIPLFKGGNKDPLNKDNHRGITLMCTYMKLLEGLMAKRDRECQELGYHDEKHELQGVSRKNVSSLHTSFLAREAIATGLERGNDVIIVALDIRKAFDGVYHKGLLYKMHEQGIRGKLWRLLRNAYDDYNCTVRVQGCNDLSESFNVEQSVHQGGVYSMELYAKYTNGLIQEICESGVGSSINGLNTTIPTYADDTMLIAYHVPVMQQLLNAVYQYSLKWRFTYHPHKCKSVIFSKGRSTQKCELSIGGVDIPVVDQLEHLGLPLIPNGNYTNFIENRIGKGRRVINSYVGVTSSHINPSNPLTISKLYWTVAMPSMLYGLEIIPLKESDYTKLSHGHKVIAKKIQGLPINTSNPAVLPQLGWSEISYIIDQMKLMFIWQLLVLPISSIYKRLTIQRLIEIISKNLHAQSPIRDIVHTCNKYGLLPDVMSMVKTALIPSKSSWKKTVKDALWDHQLNSWHLEMLTYRKLNVYADVVMFIKPISWWCVSKRYPKIVKYVRIVMTLLVGEGNLQVNKAQWSNENDRTCKLCNIDEETLIHMVLKCEKLNEERKPIVDIVEEYGCNTMNDENKLRFIFDEGQILDDVSLIAVARSIFMMYHKRDIS